MLRHKKSIAKQSFVIYNNSRDGAWCSGSTWASDSHCVGSIPIAPANANTLTCGGVYFTLLPLMLASNGQKSKRTYTQCVCVEYQRSGNGSASQDAHYYSPQRTICLHMMCAKYKRNITRSVFALSTNGAKRKHAHSVHSYSNALDACIQIRLVFHGCNFRIKQKRRTIECVAFKLKRLIVFGRQIILCRLPLRRARKRRLVLHFEIGSLGKSSKRNRRSCKRFLPISCFSFRPSCA